MTEQEIRKRLGDEGWTLTRAGEAWHITPAHQTHVVTSLREAELFCSGFDAGWLARAELDGPES